MYYDFFGFREPPFSISPDPRYLYLSERHKEALAHLMYGVQGQGGFIVITGEVGTGKTTVSRCFIENVPDHVDIALVLNPRLSARELLSAICDELEIAHAPAASIKELVSLINDDLLEAYAAGRHKVLMIDEAQNLSAAVLEQLRLLTNLETAEKKLLQIVLLGQPELQDMLALPQLRQLNQRVTARYHLEGLERREIDAYVRYRLAVAGLRGEIFSESALRALYRHSQGIPRLINLICDRALLGAYAQGEHHITPGLIRKAALEVNGRGATGSRGKSTRWLLVGSVAASAVLAVLLSLQWAGVGVDGSDGQLAGQEPVTVVGNENFMGTVERVEPVDSNENGPAAPASPAEPVVADFSFDNRLPTLGRAFEHLFGVWGREYETSQAPIACDFAETQGLRCLETRMSRQGLLFLNRPAILHLRDDAGQAGYLVLRSLSGKNAVIVGVDGKQQVAFDSIEPFWHGQFTVLWELPPYEALPGNGRGENPVDEQVWLSARLMELAGQLAEDRAEEDQVVRMDSGEQVRWYQSRKGLTVDGIAGAMTLIQMNNDLQTPVPRLDQPERLNDQAGAG
ncbi:ExeA family protein [Marinobacter confluentis]|uniref:Peptidoglycan-binding protein n=1 Tax=Marinobacter confluentis TaxID=1697557 RepID=A0A4Z1CC09_9GAMM|nr:ExeA family protein [Marinobacter confluentis]TGN41563.1 peptidoglycan-binding protein [Marinobacter confluentis]